MFRVQDEEKFAIRWLAPEVNMHKFFTIKSDIWSFGILLYELITYGSVPYPEMNDTQVSEALRTDYHMPCPEKCPYTLYYDIMQKCWMYDSALRPTFKTLQCKLKEFVVDVAETEPTHMILDFSRK